VPPGTSAAPFTDGSDGVGGLLKGFSASSLKWAKSGRRGGNRPDVATDRHGNVEIQVVEQQPLDASARSVISAKRVSR
jgi:hypothetical protein